MMFLPLLGLLFSEPTQAGGFLEKLTAMAMRQYCATALSERKSDAELKAELDSQITSTSQAAQGTPDWDRALIRTYREYAAVAERMAREDAPGLSQLVSTYQASGAEGINVTIANGVIAEVAQGYQRRLKKSSAAPVLRFMLRKRLELLQAKHSQDHEVQELIDLMETALSDYPG